MWCTFFNLKNKLFLVESWHCLPNIFSTRFYTNAKQSTRKKIWSDAIKKFFVEISKMVLKKLNHLVKTYSFRPYKTWTVNPAVLIPIPIRYWYQYRYRYCRNIWQLVLGSCTNILGLYTNMPKVYTIKTNIYILYWIKTKN